MKHLPALTTCWVAEGISTNFKVLKFLQSRLIDYRVIKLELNNNKKITRKFPCSNTVVSIFSLPLPLAPAPLTPPPTFNPTPICLCPWVLYICSLMTLPLLSLIILLFPPLRLLSVYSLFQRLWLCFACLFCWLGSLIGEIIWYLSFATWLISLSIMLSSSIHAVAEGISSFFLSAAYYSIV